MIGFKWNVFNKWMVGPCYYVRDKIDKIQIKLRGLELRLLVTSKVKPTQDNSVVFVLVNVKLTLNFLWNGAKEKERRV
jgi:hypothetical protein